MKPLKQKKYIYTFLWIILICIVLASCSVNNITAPFNADITPTEIPEDALAQNTPTLSPAPIDEPAPTVEPYTSIVIGSTGDIMCHFMQLKDAQNTAEADDTYTTNGDELYSFDHWFRHISPSLEYADLMIGNLETTIASDNSLVTGYPFFATPKEILFALKKAGFDVLLSGNNHILDKGQTGLVSTVNALDEADIHHTGAWTSLESKNIPLVVDVKGIKIGIISATSSVNEQDRLLTEAENAYMYLWADSLNEISQQIASCKNLGADVIVMCPYWGFEYDTTPSAVMLSLAQEYIKMGVDIILGHHPHVLQPAQKIQVTLDDGQTKEGAVFWSLGNFVSNQMGDIEQLAGVIGYVNITKNNTTGQITIDSLSYLPIWCYILYDNDTDSKTYCILPVGQALDSPQLFDDINIESIKTPLSDVWTLATSRLGKDTIKPLRSVSDK